MSSKKRSRTKGAPRLGQHFLRAPAAARALALAAGISPDETILEIGPGKGALTRELLRLCPRVVAIEKDEALAARLKEKFGESVASGALRVISADIRDVDASMLGIRGAYVVAANIPYYITGDILRQFLSAARQPRAMALLLQKEVAQRIVGNKESILSVSVKAYGTPRIVRKVPRSCFSPPPRVDSAVIAIEDISRDFFKDLDEKHFFVVLHAGFSSKRKFLVNNLAKRFGRGEAERAFAACGLPPSVRAEDVPLIKWKCLAQKLVARSL